MSDFGEYEASVARHMAEMWADEMDAPDVLLSPLRDVPASEEAEAEARDVLEDVGDVTGERIGLLYEKLDDVAREDHALVQTPRFVAEFLLDHSQKCAWTEWGWYRDDEAEGPYRYAEDFVRLLDPACGTGHLLVPACERAMAHFGGPPIASFDYIKSHLRGWDLNPWCVRLAQFRLAVTMWRHVQGTDSQFPQGHAPEKAVYIAKKCVSRKDALLCDDPPIAGFDAVVMNPPYVAAPEPGKYRDRFTSAHGQYGMHGPFIEQVPQWTRDDAFAAAIVSNNICQRNWAEPLIKDVIGDAATSIDLRGIVDTSGAYIPRHGTPTVMLFWRTMTQDSDRPVFSVLGKRGEPGVPDDPANAEVWSSIREHAGQGQLAHAMHGLGPYEGQPDETTTEDDGQVAMLMQGAAE